MTDRYVGDPRMGLIFDGDECLTMEETANRLNEMTERLDGINELLADIRKAVGGNASGEENSHGCERPYNYTLPWLPHSLMLRIDMAMNQEQRQ